MITSLKFVTCTRQLTCYNSKDGYEKKNAILLFEKNIEHRKIRHLASYIAFEINTIIQLSDNG